MTSHDAVTLDIKSFTVDDTDILDALYDGWAEATVVDQPDSPVLTRTEAIASLSTPPPTAVGDFHVAMVDGQVVGTVLIFMPTTLNTHFAHVEGWVHVPWRRRGVGRALRAAVEERLRELGRTVWMTRVREYPGEDVSGPAFAEDGGMTAAMTEVCRRLYVDEVNDDVIAELRADCLTRLDGYEVLRWEDGVSGPHPEEYVDGLARLEIRMDTDAPTGDIDVKPRTEPEPDGIRARSKRSALQGLRCFNTAVRHIESGDIVAWTMLAMHTGGAEDFAFQNITVVHPEHRGRKFGTLVKLENLAAIREAAPNLRIIETSNADENAHMIAINDVLGFRVFCLVHNYQKEL